MCCYVVSRFIFVCKQKTAYEMRISDWSSDVCSSDLRLLVMLVLDRADDLLDQILEGEQPFGARIFVEHDGEMGALGAHFREQVQRAHAFGNIERLADQRLQPVGNRRLSRQYGEGAADVDHAHDGV